jgi:hypothetical protein
MSPLLAPVQLWENRVAAWTEELGRTGYVIVHAADLPEEDLGARRNAIGRGAQRAGIRYVGLGQHGVAGVYEVEHARRRMRTALRMGEGPR